MRKKYYKVVVYHNDCFKSCMYESLPTNLVIYYEVDKWIFPNDKTTSILVFDNLSDAKIWAYRTVRHNEYRIFECNVKNPRNIRQLFNLKIGNMPTRFWSEKNKAKKLHKKFEYFGPTWVAPSGTKVVNAVKLIREIS